LKKLTKRKKTEIMAKGDYNGPKYGGSRGGWEKGKKDAERKNLIMTLGVAVGTFVLGLLANKLKK
jgi:hypothetical protein